MRRLLRAALLLASLGACDDPLAVDALDSTGHWEMRFLPAESESEFVLDLREDASGVISGTWSNPNQFSYNGMRGRREAAELELVGDSPNIFPAYFTLEFVKEDRLIGFFYFGLDRHDVVLLRTRETPDEPLGGL